MALRAYPILRNHPDLEKGVDDLMFVQAMLSTIEDGVTVSAALLVALVHLRDRVAKSLLHAVVRSSPIDLEMEPRLAVVDGEFVVICDVAGPPFDPNLN